MHAAALDLSISLPSTAAQATGAPGPQLRIFSEPDQTGALLQAACRSGQLEDAAAAARAGLALADPRSPYRGLLLALAQTSPVLLHPPQQDRLYLLRGADGAAQGLLRLRDNGLVGAVPTPATGLARWALRGGQVELGNDDGQALLRFGLCGEQDGLRVYLGQAVADGSPRLLQELRSTYARLRGLDPELAIPLCAMVDAEALVPAELPPRAALLLAAPHCGADALRAALNRAPGIGLDGELLHPLAIGLGEGRLALAEAGALADLRTSDPAWFVRMLLNRSQDERGVDLSELSVRGFTLAPQQSRAALDWAIATPGLRIVHLVRSNLLAQFADILAGPASAGSGASATPALPFDAERFLHFVAVQQRALAQLRARLVQRDGDTVEVDSSRLNQATLDALLGFLTDREPSAAPTGATPPDAGPVIARFADPQAVRACLDRLGQADWAEAEHCVAATA